MAVRTRSFRKRPAKRAIEKAIHESIGGARERGPKFAFRLGGRCGVGDQSRHNSGDDWFGLGDRHPHRKGSTFGGNQLPIHRDHIFQIPHFRENTTLDPKHGLTYLLEGRHLADMRDVNLERFRSGEARRALAHHEDRSTTGPMRGDDETIEDGQPGDFQATRPGVAHQDGGRLFHCAGLRLPPPKTPRSPK